MNRIWIFFLIFFAAFFNAQDLKDFRTLLQKGENSESASELLIQTSKKAFEKSRKPIFEAFFAVGNFFMAKHATNPISKYAYFNKGKKALNNAVIKDPVNLEIRFMRYLSQESSPALLGYKTNLAADKKFILLEVKKSTDEALIRRIKNHFKI
ncbi:hypothetical protein [Chryseobacterium sp.]|uniref:hypothetical protein n=1 Tax=Chryseobacterium sp. TaxID=1871047 RepID=UPI0011C961A8|nr:hypothetical protein [Chryseobacterium sp.]TXF79139.1 hypothetical protein FUA25_01730 [Chryseobacterium sp.]